MCSSDRSAFDEIFDAHSRAVYAHAVRTLGDWAAAEDVMSLTFLEAWRLRHKLRDEVVSVRAWLLGIAVNVMRNRARTARRHRAAMSRLQPHDALPDFSDEVVDRLADAERLSAAVRALATLRRREREVFTLVVWSGLSYGEVSATLGIPVGTVRSRLSRARTKLRRTVASELGRETPEPGPAGGHIQSDGEGARDRRGNRPAATAEPARRTPAPAPAPGTPGGPTPARQLPTRHLSVRGSSERKPQS